MTENEIARLRKRLRDRPAGPFHFHELYGDDWDRLWIGDKVRIGREFLNAVRAGRFFGVEDTGHKDRGGHLYLWAGL